jgi:hypothetical protein
MNVRISRRLFLGAGAAAVTALMYPSTTAWALKPAAPTRAKAFPHVRLADIALPVPTPFQVQASCELSEDYFLSDQVIVQATDRIMPFSRPDGTVEALVLSGGNLAHLHKDSAATTGWTYTVVQVGGYGAAGTVLDACVRTGPSGVVSAFVSYSSYGGVLVCLHVDNDGNWSLIDSEAVQTPPRMWALHAGTTPAGAVFFYMFNVFGVFTVWYLDADGGAWATSQLTAPGGLTSVVDAVLLWDPAQIPNSFATGAALIRTADDVLSTFGQATPLTFNSVPDTTDGIAALLWAGLSADLDDLNPNFVSQDVSGQIGFTDSSGDQVELDANYGETLGDGQVTVWQNGGLYGFAFLTDNLIEVITGYGDPNAPEFTDAIPLQDGFERIYGLPTDPTEATLFAVDAAETLTVLTKNPVLGWSAVPVHQDGATLQEISTWRVQVSVIDANQTRVPGADVVITADREVGVWQATGNTILGPGAPVTMTTDPMGRLTFAVPAVELDTAILTVQAVVDGVPNGAAFIVNPDIDTHRFLSGAAPSTNGGTLTGAGMLAAKNSTGAPLFPTLANLTGSNQTDGATAMASALNHMVGAGLGNVPGDDDAKSVLLDMTGAAPSFTSNPPAAALHELAELRLLSGWWDGAIHDVESAYHGLRHGVIAMEKAASTWVKDEADDAYHWVVNLAVTLGQDISDVMDLVITDLKSAIHAASSFFQALGADIEEGLNWLKHQIFQLIKDAEANAKVIEGWLDQLPALATAQLTQYENLADTYFVDLEQSVHDNISLLATDLEQLAFGSSAPLPPPSNDSGSSNGGALGDVATFLGDISHNWLLDKIMSWFTGDDPMNASADLSQALSDLKTALEDALHFADDIATDLYDTFKLLFSDRNAYDVATFGSVFAALDAAVHELLQFADAMVDTVLEVLKATMAALGDALDHEIQTIPLLGSLLDLVGIDTSMSVGHLVSLALMYPTTLLQRTMHSGVPLFPTSALGQTAALESKNGVGVDPKDDPWSLGLNFASGLVQGLWGGADFFEDLYRPGGTGEAAAPNFLSWVDIISPIVIQLLQWPSAANATTGLTSPPLQPMDPNQPYPLLNIGQWVLGMTPPALQLVGKITGDGDYSNNLQPYLVTAAAIGQTITGTVLNYKVDASTWLIAGTILGNISNVIAPFSTKTLADSTEDISLVIKLMVDLAGNEGAAFCFVSYADS